MATITGHTTDAALAADQRRSSAPVFSPRSFGPTLSGVIEENEHFQNVTTPEAVAFPMYRDTPTPIVNPASADTIASLHAATPDAAAPVNATRINDRATHIVTSVLKYIVGTVHNWYWCLGVGAIVAYTVQCVIQAITLSHSDVARNVGYTIVIYGTAIFMVLEQVIAKFFMARAVKVCEFLLSAFVIICSLIGWALWSVRGNNPVLEPIGMFCFDLIEVALMLRFAYRSLVGNFEVYPEHYNPSMDGQRPRDVGMGLYHMPALPLQPVNGFSAAGTLHDPTHCHCRCRYGKHSRFSTLASSSLGGYEMHQRNSTAFNA